MTTFYLKYRDLLIVLPMREQSIFRGIAVSLLRPVIGYKVIWRMKAGKYVLGYNKRGQIDWPASVENFKRDN